MNVLAAKLFLCGLAALVLFSGKANQSQRRAESHGSLRKPAAYPQLVSFDPVARIDGEMCQWLPVKASSSAMAALQQDRSANERSAASAAEPAASVEVDRAPVRQIRDTYPTYSALAVDLQTEEVYLQDENLYGYKVFNRLDNTPPAAAFTEPKRVVQGLLTKMEFNCALYVDPNNGDVYSVNNDMVDTMVVFPRSAKGNAEPKQQLHTPHRTYGIAVDEAAQEIYLTVQYPPKIVVYSKSASGEQKPVRTLEGDQTQLADPHGIAIDPKNEFMFVSNHGSVSTHGVAVSGKFGPPSIVVLPLKASGNSSPLRVIEGSATRLNWPAALFLDVDRSELYVANDADDSLAVFRETDSRNARILQGPDTRLRKAASVAVDPVHNLMVVLEGDSLFVFNRTDEGNTKPLATIRPPANTHFRSSQIQIYPPKGWIFVATVTRKASYSWEMEFEGAGIGIWSISDNGQVRPRWNITGPQSRLKSSRAVAFNAKDKEVYVADMRQNAILTYYFPEAF